MFYCIYDFCIEKMSESLISSSLVCDVSGSLRSLTKNERCEKIAQVAHQKWTTMSNSLRLLRGNERMSELLLFLSELLLFGQKTSDSLGKPMSEFPALVIWRFRKIQRMQIQLFFRFPIDLDRNDFPNWTEPSCHMLFRTDTLIAIFHYIHPFCHFLQVFVTFCKFVICASLLPLFNTFVATVLVYAL